MKNVGTTKTASDAQLELKDVQLEINRFKSVKENAQREVDELVSSIEDLRKRKKDLEEVISVPYTDLAQFVGTAGRIVNESILAMNASVEVAEGFSKLINKLSERIDIQHDELEQIENKKKEALALISAEEARLSKVKEDLDIYRKRLQKKIDVYGLSDEIKIIL